MVVFVHNCSSASCAWPNARLLKSFRFTFPLRVHTLARDVFSLPCQHSSLVPRDSARGSLDVLHKATCHLLLPPKLPAWRLDQLINTSRDEPKACLGFISLGISLVLEFRRTYIWRPAIHLVSGLRCYLSWQNKAVKIYKIRPVWGPMHMRNQEYEVDDKGGEKKKVSGRW